MIARLATSGSVAANLRYSSLDFTVFDRLISGSIVALRVTSDWVSVRGGSIFSISSSDVDGGSMPKLFFSFFVVALVDRYSTRPPVRTLCGFVTMSNVSIRISLNLFSKSLLLSIRLSNVCVLCVCILSM